MIRLSFSNKENALSFVARGHAAYAEEGEPDILCAAISALCATVVGSLQENLKLEPEYRLEEGHLYAKQSLESLEENEKKAVELLFQTLYVGAKQISLSYGERYLKVDELII